MYRRIAGYMKENHMTEAGYTVLAGVSGGSDSMLMLTILRELQKPLDFKLAAVHVHHGIRGQEADRDRAFVEQICEEWGIPCHVFHYDVPALSSKWKLGEEETGRLVRREAFEKAAHSYADHKVRIALAHNQEDLAETMLHNLCRGTGLRGLCTMRPTAEKIIRPILCLNRREIADFLEKYQIPYVFIQGIYTEMKDKPHILMDDAKGGYLVTKYLLDLGHRRITGFFKADDIQGIQRHKGYVKALQEDGIPYDPDQVVWFHTEDRRSKPSMMVKEMVKSGQLPDGIVCYNDQIAVQVIETLEACGLRVPEDVSVVGFNNYLYPELADREITTYEVNIKAMTKVALEKVLKQIKNPKRGHGMDIVSGRMVIKKSVKLKK